jgi:hypothetical protein
MHGHRATVVNAVMTINAFRRPTASPLGCAAGAPRPARLPAAPKRKPAATPPIALARSRTSPAGNTSPRPAPVGGGLSARGVDQKRLDLKLKLWFHQFNLSRNYLLTQESQNDCHSEVGELWRRRRRCRM